MASFASASGKTLWCRVKSIPKEYPLAFGVVFSGMKTSCSDLLVQKVVEQKEQIDWKRNAAFASFGFCYLGYVQYMIYVPFFSRIFPGAASFAAKPLVEKWKDFRGMFQLGAQVVLDQCVHHPLMYFPAFYCTREFVMHEKPDLRRCLAEYRKNMKDDLIALWKIWVPATVINFAFMPMHARIPFVACVSLLWTCILSAMRGGDLVHGEELAGGAVTGATLTMIEEEISAFFTSPVELDREKQHLMISASGHDKPGWVALVSRAVADAGGNITHSRMVRLGSEFIILMHVSVEPGKYPVLLKQIQTNPNLKPLNVQCNTISRRRTGTFQPAVMGVRVRCVGPDKPGMLAAISESLLRYNLSIENATTELHQRRGGGTDFEVSTDCVTAAHMDQKEIETMVHQLEQLKEPLGLDTLDIRVQRLVPRPVDD